MSQSRGSVSFVMISSGRRAVSSKPWKNSSTGTSRPPSADSSVTVASTAVSSVAGSECGSAKQRFPPIVPAARTLAKDLEMDPNDPGAIACAGELVLEFLYVHNRLSKVRRRGGAAYGR